MTPRYDVFNSCKKITFSKAVTTLGGVTLLQSQGHIMNSLHNTIDTELVWTYFSFYSDKT